MTARMGAEAGAEVCVGNAGMSAETSTEVCPWVHTEISAEVCLGRH